jgi:hypothetical protein
VLQKKKNLLWIVCLVIKITFILLRVVCNMLKWIYTHNTNKLYFLLLHIDCDIAHFTITNMPEIHYECLFYEPFTPLHIYKASMTQLFNHLLIYCIISPLSASFLFSVILMLLTTWDISGIFVLPTDFSGKEHVQHIKIHCTGLLVQGRFVVVFQTSISSPSPSVVVFKWSFKKQHLKQVYSIDYGGIYLTDSTCFYQ